MSTQSKAQKRRTVNRSSSKATKSPKSATGKKPADDDVKVKSKRAKGGRPAVDDALAMNTPLPSKCSKAQKAIIQSKAKKSGLSLSAYVREMALNGKIIVRKSVVPAVQHDDIVLQGIRSGTNLNQIAAVLNKTQGYVPRDLADAIKKHNEWMDAVFKLDEKDERKK